MDKKYTIVVDTLGSDQGPLEVLRGVSLVLTEFPEVDAVVTGDENVLTQGIKDLNIDESRISIIDAPDTITNYDNPMECLFKKPNASILQALKYAGGHDEVIGIVSAGSSGAILCGSIRYMIREDKTHPCMCAILPNMAGSYTALVDTGATIDCNALQLVNYAHLGTELMRGVYKIENPRVGLLSNGAEPTKGNHLVKETFPLLEADKSINFIGNVEGNKTLSGMCDVLVCDGFAGNQVLKNSEGMAINIITEIIKYGKHIHQEEICGQIVNHLMKTYDFSQLGGAVVLGAKKMVMKCRGNSGALAIRNAAHILINIAENKTIYEGEEDSRHY